MVILHFLVTDRLSGSENVVLDMLRHFKDTDEVYYVSPEGPIRGFVEAAGINYIACNTEGVAEIKRVYREIKPDVVHACDPRMSFKCALAGIPFIAHFHSNCSWMRKYSPNSFALLYTIKRADAVITVSDSIEREYVFRRAMRGKLHMIPNAVDAEKVREAAGEPFENRFDVVYVGRLSAEKQPLVFLKLIKKLSSRLPSVSAVMVGDGDCMGECRRFIGENGLDNVSLLGFDSNPYKVINNSKICVNTSAAEGFGLVAVESLSLGKPVLAFPVGGLNDIINSDCGALCQSIDEMADSAFELLTDEAEYRRKSDGAFKRSALFTDLKAYNEKIRRLYAEIIRQRSMKRTDK